MENPRNAADQRRGDIKLHKDRDDDVGAGRWSSVPRCADSFVVSAVKVKAGGRMIGGNNSGLRFIIDTLTGVLGAAVAPDGARPPGG